MPDLLIELFSEEIPARMQRKARDDMKRLITDGLVAAGLSYAGAGAFSTPRRLTLALEGLDAASLPQREERKGPRIDAPAAALEGFLRATGQRKEQLEIRQDKKAQVYFAVIEKPGRPAEEIIADVLSSTIRNFPWPKSMRWGSGNLRWVRPLHAILCVLSDETGARIVPMELDGITASDHTYGHRFLAPAALRVSSWDDYAAKLKRAFVILDTDERAETILQGARNLAFAAGMELVEDPALLADVAGLVEWPVPLMGRIDEAFLTLPPEVLQTSMREHQKFFSTRNTTTGQIEGFVTVANIKSDDGGAAILHGNQKVLRARLSDADFFWKNDLRIAENGMDEWAEGLSNVTFHNKLGSQAERVVRIETLARSIAETLGGNADDAASAARLAKLDLRSAMVGEFPELQGVMGRYYATKSGAPQHIADAVRDHYAPLGPSDAVPDAPVCVSVALADKLDTLMGFWSIDEKPTGSKDPFALRRAALGVIRLCQTNGLRLPLFPLMRTRLDTEKAENLLAFIHDRLKVSLRDQGIGYDAIDACLAMPGGDDLALLIARAEALGDVLATEDGKNLVQGFRRANNILTQAEARDKVEYSFGPDIKYAENDTERALFSALDSAQTAIKQAMAREDFTKAMQSMAQLRGPIDAFFTAVQINSDNQIVRRNRLNLLHRVRTVCSGVADLSRLDGEAR